MGFWPINESIRIYGLASLLALPMGLSAQVDEEGIIQRSPFIPQNWNPPNSQVEQNNTPPVNTALLEFRGVYKVGDTYHFNILNKRNKLSTWVTLSEEGSEYQVLEYDEAENSIRLKSDTNENITLTMNIPNHRPMAVAGANKTEKIKRPTPKTRRRVVRPSSSNQTNTRRRVIRRP